MNNKLHLRAVRRRATSALNTHNILRGSWNHAQAVVGAVSPHRVALLHAQWQRDAATGALKCHWASDSPTAPQMDRSKACPAFSFHMHGHVCGTGLRPPPLCHRIRG